MGTRHRHIIATATGVVLILFGSVGSAQEFPEPTDRNHTLDVYVGAALGSGRIVGMGGAATAAGEGSAGSFANPAATAVRTATSNGTWDWDWSLDILTPTIGDDLDNNGIKQEDALATNASIGILGMYKQWGLGLYFLEQTRFARALPGVHAKTTVGASEAKITLARSFLKDQVVVGLSARLAFFSLGEPNVSIGGTGLDVGAVWKPHNQDVRFGAAFKHPIIGDELSGACNPMDCEGFILPEKLKVPWQASLGFAQRHALSVWNQKVSSKYRDEKAWIWAVDLVLTGRTKNGVGLEAFGLHQLQPSGRKISISLRSGVEYEWVPGRFRVRSGSYWEASRYKDPTGRDVPGRLHLTAGFDWRIWTFDFWDKPRLRLTATMDVAKAFGNSGLSIGLWH